MGAAEQKGIMKHSNTRYDDMHNRKDHELGVYP